MPKYTSNGHATRSPADPQAAKRAVPNSAEDIARACLAHAGNDPDRAIANVSKYIRGARLRAVIAAIGTAFLRTSADGRSP